MPARSSRAVSRVVFVLASGLAAWACGGRISIEGGRDAQAADAEKSDGAPVDTGANAGDASGPRSDAASWDTGPRPDAGGKDAGPCVPNCAGVICGGDDGCGQPCSGSHREEAGSVSDCRAGDCGCGAPGIDNTVCTSSGQCRVHCACDCLPPQLVAPGDLVGLDHAAACLLVFQRSGDPTVYDANTGQALCPLDHDPQGAARCRECPPCHRPHPPECGWADWCTCTDPRWYDDYHNQCCAAGAEYCY